MNSSQPHADDLIGAYVLDAVDDDERRLVDAHLSECAACRTEVRELGEAVFHLNDGSDVAPPTYLRAQILTAIAATSEGVPDSAEFNDAAAMNTSEKSRQTAGRLNNKSVWGLAAAGLLAVGGWGIWQNVSDDLSPIDEVIQAADAETFTAQYEGETLSVVASSSLDRAVLQAGDLPTLDEGKTYQAWWVGADQTITSAGVISSDASLADLEVALEGDPDGGSAFALSVEPTGGSQQPTTDPIVVVPLS